MLCVTLVSVYAVYVFWHVLDETHFDRTNSCGWKAAAQGARGRPRETRDLSDCILGPRTGHKQTNKNKHRLRS